MLPFCNYYGIPSSKSKEQKFKFKYCTNFLYDIYVSYIICIIDYTKIGTNYKT